MRNLLTSAIASVALATLFIGSASAADMSSYSSRNVNPAEQAQLERDATQHYLRQGLGAGELVAPGGQTAETADRANQGASADGHTAWLDQSPNGEAVHQAAAAPGGKNSSHD